MDDRSHYMVSSVYVKGDTGSVATDISLAGTDTKDYPSSVSSVAGAEKEVADSVLYGTG